MTNETLYEEYTQDKEFERLMAQEDLIIQVTESFCKILENENIKRKDLAELLGKTKGFISQILNGTSNVTLRTISDIAQVLGHRVDFKIHKKNQVPKRDTFYQDWDENTLGRFNNINPSDDYPSTDSATEPEGEWALAS
ncbi:MAG: helix-turn-helix transcriptional regulator [Desulfatitalea sp.]|nr:helix-turn-helix domain-containing protein [Desulfatitalea sp.]NNK00405.1 helix-turn-helix transcriptional regulator [Desulfatitalea sp.]